MANWRTEMSKPQTITTPGGEELVVLSRADYEELRAAARYAEADDSVHAIGRTRARLENLEEEKFPHNVVVRLRQENRIKVLREHRGLTQRALAEEADMNPLYLSQIETGRATGGLRTLTKLAQVLRVQLDLIAPPPARSERE